MTFRTITTAVKIKPLETCSKTHFYSPLLHALYFELVVFIVFIVRTKKARLHQTTYVCRECERHVTRHHTCMMDRGEGIPEQRGTSTQGRHGLLVFTARPSAPPLLSTQRRAPGAGWSRLIMINAVTDWYQAKVKTVINGTRTLTAVIFPER